MVRSASLEDLENRKFLSLPVIETQFLNRVVTKLEAVFHSSDYEPKNWGQYRNRKRHIFLPSAMLSGSCS